MAPPSLKHYAAVSGNASTWTPIHAAVGAGRALVISKIVVANGSVGTCTFNLAIGDSGNTGQTNIARDITLAAGQVYTETGLVAVAGEYVRVAASIGGGGVVVNVFGEEVDNV